MKKLITLFFALLCTLSLNAQSWKSIGGANPFPNTFEHDFTIRDNSRPVVAMVLDPSNQIDVRQWDGAEWVQLPQPTALNVSEVEVTHLGNQIIVGYYENNTEYFVKVFNGSDWDPFGDIAVFSEFKSSMEIIPGANTGEFWASFVSNGTGNNAIVKKYNGLSWTLHGNDVIQFFPDNVDGRVASDGSKVYYLSNDQGPLESLLYNANEGAPGFSQYGGSQAVSDPVHINLECSPGKMPSLGYVDQGGLGILNFSRPDGVGDFYVDETFNTGPGSIGNFDHAMGADDSIFFVYTANTGEVIVNHQEGGTLFQYGSAVSTVNPTSSSIEIFKNSDKPTVMIKDDVNSRIFTYNNMPVYSANSGATNVCQEVVGGSFLTSITFLDNDFDSLYVIPFSNTPALLTSGNVNITRTNAYSSSSNQNIFSIDVSPVAGQFGTALIDLYVTDGYDTLTYGVSVIVDALPSVGAGTDFAVCDGDPVTLNGTGAISYLWDNSVTDGVSFNPASTLTYTVSGTDLSGCVNTDAIIVTVNPSPTFTVSTIPVDCFGNSTGKMDISGLLSFTNYDVTYTKVSTVGPSTETSTGIGEINLFGFSVGTFTNIIVTNLSGCSHAEAGPYSLLEPANLVNTPGADQNICDGVSVTLNGTAVGGTLPYTFSWDQAVIDGVSFTPSPGSLTYNMTNTDGNGCIATDNLDITVNLLPTFSVVGNDPTTCSGSDGYFDISGLNPLENFSLDYYDGASTQGPFAIVANGAGNTSYGSLVAGNYDNFNIVDMNGCIGISLSPVPLFDPASPTYSISSVDPTTCGGTDGTITISGLTPLQPFDITYFDGVTTQGPTSMPSDGAGNVVLTGLGADTYTIFDITNAALCTTSDAGPYVLSDPPLPTIVAGTDQIVCEGAGVTLTAFNPNAAVISWDNGVLDGIAFFPSPGIQTYTATAALNGCINTDQVDVTVNPLPLAGIDGSITFCASDPSSDLFAELTGLPDGGGTWAPALNSGTGVFDPGIDASGVYTYTVTNGCGSDDATVAVTVNALPTVNAGLDFNGCDADILTLNGAGALSYVWDNGVTDGVPFTQAIGTTTYNITGTDVNLCQNIDSIDITIFANPPAFSVNMANPTVCGALDGSFMLTGLTPFASYNVTYNNGSVQGPFVLSASGAGDLDILTLNAGSYTDIEVTNLNGCSTTNPGPYSLSDPSAPTVNAGTDVTICNGEPIELTATNSANALINWNNGVINGHTFFPSTTFTYTVTASSAGCVASDQVTVTVNSIPDPGLVIADATCANTDGFVNSTITNGLAPYSIYWSNGTTGTSINNLGAALYYINVTDANGCYAMEVASVSSTAMSVSGFKTDNDCADDENGAVDLVVTGNSPFTFSWSNGSISEDITGLASGQYEVMITDNTGCKGGASFIINEPLPVYGELASTNATCGLANGSIVSTVLGGATPYAYEWKDELGSVLTGEFLSSITNYGVGAYSLNVTDVSGCTSELFGGISEDNGPVVTVDSLVASTCADDGTINVDVNSAFAISTYAWSNGGNTEDQSAIGAGQYHITVEDINGCSGVLAVELPAVLPTAIEICIVGVDTSTNTNLVVWEKPITDEIAYFNVYRESSIAGMFQLVDSLSYNQESSYNDTIAYPGLRSWRYRLGTVDTCGNESILSEAHKTIHITYSSTAGVYDLAWDHYEGFAYPTYYIWRHTDQNGWEEIAQIPSTNTTYQNTPPSEAGIDYIIEIQPPFTCTSTLKATDYNSSRSNKADGVNQSGPDDSGIGSNEIEFELYPNPTEGQFKLALGEWSNYFISLFDVSGKLVFSSTISGKNAILDISHLESGSYLMKVTSENGEGNSQLIKH